MLYHTMRGFFGYQSTLGVVPVHFLCQTPNGGERCPTDLRLTQHPGEEEDEQLRYEVDRHGEGVAVDMVLLR